jgi:hypothetical protein
MAAPFQLSTPATDWLQSRAEQKLTAGNQPARSLLASGPGGTRGLYLLDVETFVFFSPSLILLNDKEEGVGPFFFPSRCFLTTP